MPGSSCQLVIIDRIPFPRPDDPLASARSQAIARMGGNGFMAVSATHAALRLAQGAGRLVRRADDRGVVAFLDSRMMTARYAGFLQRSLPPFWPTTDRAMVLAALQAARRDRRASRCRCTSRRCAGSPAPSPRRGDPTAGDAAAPVPVERPVAEDPPPPESSRTAVTQGHAWTEQEDEELRDGIELGLSLDELAESHRSCPSRPCRPGWPGSGSIAARRNPDVLRRRAAHALPVTAGLRRESLIGGL